jgi:hypothetical protein
MKTKKFFTIAIIISLLFICLIPKTKGETVYNWVYEEIPNGYVGDISQGVLAGYQGYNSFSVSEITQVNVMSMYAFLQPSNLTFTSFIRLAIYSSNVSILPELLLASSSHGAILNVGWTDFTLDNTVTLQPAITYFISWLHRDNDFRDWRHYFIPNNNDTGTYYHNGFVVWDTFANPAHVEGQLPASQRLGCFRLGLSIDEDIETNAFLNMLENPTIYIGGIIVIGLIITIIYVIIRKR